MSFRDEIRRRGWNAKKTATHFLLDGGKLHVPDEDNGTFYNVYFNHAILKREPLSVVELKTAIFPLFFDIDGRWNHGASNPQKTIRVLAGFIYDFVTKIFFEIDTSGASTSAQPAVDRSKMIVCASPPKRDNTTEKHGVHIIFPNIIVNAPIAIACRERLLCYISQCDFGDAEMPMNEMSDVVDDSVFKANGLRMIWSNKGKTEGRAYVPSYWVDNSSTGEYVFDSVIQKRDLIRETSIRRFNEPLTPCSGGEHLIADKMDVHEKNGVVIGTSTSVDMYGDVLPEIRSLLPQVYNKVVFTAAFVTSHAVMLKSNSRYCQNKQGEHRTSTVYFCVTRQGICQRCYCRKEDRGCDKYASKTIKLPERVSRVFFPDFLDDTDEVSIVRKPVKKRMTSIEGMLKRTRLLKKR
jgi:hypothetical protein